LTRCGDVWATTGPRPDLIEYEELQLRLMVLVHGRLAQSFAIGHLFNHLRCLDIAVADYDRAIAEFRKAADAYKRAMARFPCHGEPVLQGWRRHDRAAAHCPRRRRAARPLAGREASTIFRPSWASSRPRCGLSIPFELLLIERAGGRCLARVSRSSGEACSPVRPVEARLTGVRCALND
jgi:hypothetical protein